MKKTIIVLIIFLGVQMLSAQKKVAIYWDTSYSMKDRQLSQELNFLNNYFKKNKEANVTLILFSNDIILNEDYIVNDGNWNNLMQELQNTIYDGATTYSNLFKEEYDEYLLFTDGIENLDKLKPTTSKPVYVVSSTPNSNNINLKLIADLSSGKYVNLNKNDNIQVNKENVKESLAEEKNGYISGIVSGTEGVLANTSIINQNSKIGVATNSNGNYKIKAKENDILVFTYLGKKTVRIRLLEANAINVFMQDIGESLDEVVITAKSDKEDLVNTGNATVDKRSLGYAIESIGEDDISGIDTNIKRALKGQFSGMKIANDAGYTRVDISQFLGRGNNMSILGDQYGLIVLDGVPLPKSSSATGQIHSLNDIINPDMIVNVTYLKGLAATNKYGTIGANGVLLITTKNAVGDKVLNKNKAPLGTTGTFNGNAEQISKLPDTPYINMMKTSKSIDEAFKNYLSQREIYGNQPVFYLDCYDYFKGWKNEILSKRVLSNVYEIGFNDAAILRAMSYKQQAGEDYKGAVKTLERVLKLNPKQSQSYRDLALAKTYAQDIQGALKLYDKMDKNIGVGNSNFRGINKSITNDAKNLLSKHKNELNTTGINEIYFRPIKYRARIIFEWSNFNSEFDLNIINPQKRFFTSSNTRAESFQKMEQQKREGYGLEEFYLTSSDVGEWTFNLKYFGISSKTKSPTFLKVTVYKNFGHVNETKEIIVVRLEKQNIEQTVATIIVN